MSEQLIAPAAYPMEVEALLFRAALLAGLGARARTIAREVSAGLEDRAVRQGLQRTCIDAGRALMLSVRAPGGRGLRVLTRVPDAAAGPGVSRWHRAYYRADGGCERCITETYARSGREAWTQAIRTARRAGEEAAFRRYHAALGTQGRLFSVSWRPQAEGAVSFAWHLDRHGDPARALAACGAGDAWPAAVDVLRQLLGHYVSHRCGPWSIACDLGEQGAGVRLGTTQWALGPEDARKGRRLASAIADGGGDGRFAEALYKLLSAARPAASTARIGRAVEVELRGARVGALEGYLCVAS